MKTLKLITQKGFLLVLFFSFMNPIFSFSQNKKETNIYTLDFSQENNKKFTVSKTKKNFIFRTFNKSKKEVQTCKWEVKLNENQTQKLVLEIENSLSDNNYNADNYLFNIKQNKKYMKLIFKKSRCIAEHKLYYLQKDCNKSFIIKMKKKEFGKLIQNLKNKKEDI